MSDIHTETAMKLFNCKEEDVIFEMRQIAKRRNFLDLYGNKNASLNYYCKSQEQVDCNKLYEQYYNIKYDEK